MARGLPVPMMNIVNGGVHADNPIDFRNSCNASEGAQPRLRSLGGPRSEIFHPLKAAMKAPRDNPHHGA